MGQRIVQIHNTLSDKDLIWFPFIGLKPKPHQTIGIGRILLMSLCFGSYGFLVWLIKSLLFSEASFSLDWIVYLYFVGGFFIWFRFVTSFMWNIRAKQLRNMENGK